MHTDLDTRLFYARRLADEALALGWRTIVVDLDVLMEYIHRADHYQRELIACRQRFEAACERIAAQSDALSRRAEAQPVEARS